MLRVCTILLYCLYDTSSGVYVEGIHDLVVLSLWYQLRCLCWGYPRSCCVVSMIPAQVFMLRVSTILLCCLYDTSSGVYVEGIHDLVVLSLWYQLRCLCWGYPRSCCIVSMIPAQVFMLRVSTILLCCLYDTSSGVYVEGIHDLVVLSLWYQLRCLCWGYPRSCCIVSMIPAQVFMLRVSTTLLYCLYDTSSGVYVEGIHDLVVLSLWYQLRCLCWGYPRSCCIVSMIPAQVFMLRVSTILLYCLYDTSSGVYVEGIHDLVVLSLWYQLRCLCWGYPRSCCIVSMIPAQVFMLRVSTTLLYCLYDTSSGVYVEGIHDLVVFVSMIPAQVFMLRVSTTLLCCLYDTSSRVYVEGIHDLVVLLSSPPKPVPIYCHIRVCHWGMWMAFTDCVLIAMCKDK